LSLRLISQRDIAHRAGGVLRRNGIPVLSSFPYAGLRSDVRFPAAPVRHIASAPRSICRRSRLLRRTSPNDQFAITFFGNSLEMISSRVMARLIESRGLKTLAVSWTAASSAKRRQMNA